MPVTLTGWALWLALSACETAAPSWLPPGGEIELRSPEGPLSLEAARGSVVLLYFGFASCPDVCPTSLASVATALRALSPEERAHVRAIFVSLDPERDTPEILDAYTELFHPEIVGATGSRAQIAQAALRYGIAWRKTEVDSALGYVIDHSSSFSIVSPDGQLVEQLRHGSSPEEIASALRRWLP